ncbi:hypothetical protein [Mesonia maritima]|uniref:Myosin heavy subunit n=1 Tax=Mesonia maritima TaxID=1793873 RepID=A0ABU1KAF4_9FLAO|nr:hypothetical protein [Mesonia maritima]MDR6302271.1 myosin heavy subunit [Mesonia maritima]
MEKEIRNIEQKLNLLIDYLQQEEKEKKELLKDHKEVGELTGEIKEVSHKVYEDLVNHGEVLKSHRIIVESHFQEMNKYNNSVEYYMNKIPTEIECIRHITLDPLSYKRAISLFYIIFFTILTTIIVWIKCV